MVVVLHLTMLQAACTSLEVLNISGHVSFSMFMFKHRAASREGRVFYKCSQLLYVNIISKEVKGCVGKAEPLSRSAAASAPAVCPPSCWGLGHHVGWARPSSSEAQIKVRICKKSPLVPQPLGLGGQPHCPLHCGFYFFWFISESKGDAFFFFFFLVEAEILLCIVLPAGVLQGWGLSSAGGCLAGSFSSFSGFPCSLKK